MSRRILACIAMLALTTLTAACGDDGGTDPATDDVADTEPEGTDEPDASADDGPPDDPAPEDGAPEPDDTEDVSDGGSGTSGAPIGRLEVDGEAYDLTLGDRETARCDVADDAVLIQDMRAPDGRWVVATVSLGGAIWEAVLREPDGSIVWMTGNTGDAEGLDASFVVADNEFSATGTWIRSDDPSTTTEGRLVVTC